jgi:hypothetical protein
MGGGSGNTISISANSVVCGGSSQNLQYGNNCFIGGGGSNYMFDEPYVTICGGLSNSVNTGSQGYVFIGGGRSNNVTKSYSTIGGGFTNASSSDYGTIGGGRENTASTNAYTTIGGGYLNTASGTVSTVTGGFYAVADLYGQQAHASGRFSAQGDAQAHELIWRRAITGTAQTELFLDGASIAAILPGTNSVWNGIIDITSICTVTGDGTTVVGHVEATAYKVTIKRIGTTTSLVGGVQEIGITNADASMATAVFTIDNNDTNESLRVRFTPPSTAGSTTVIRVVATFRGTQIQY